MIFVVKVQRMLLINPL